MKVQRVEIKDMGISLQSEKYKDIEVPHTFFELDSAEQRSYDSFRAKHNSLVDLVRQKPKPGQEQELENETENEFIRIIDPYFNQIGLKVSRCGIYYGNFKKALITTPTYTLFENGEPFDARFDVSFWFSIGTENLSSTSSLTYRSNDDYMQLLINDLLRCIIGKKTQNEIRDGINSPIVIPSSFIHFGSTNFAMPLLLLMKSLLEKIGKDNIDELKALLRGSQKSISRETFDEKVQQKTLREAYERKIQTELLKAGFLVPHQSN